METAALFLANTDEARLLAALRERGLVDGDAQRARDFVYFRLVAPERSRISEELVRLTGDLEPEPGELWVTHPFECWIAADAASPEGMHRPHATLPVDMLDTHGAPIAQARGVEVRTLPANAPYLVLALADAGFVRPLLRILD